MLGIKKSNIAHLGVKRDNVNYVGVKHSQQTKSLNVPASSGGNAQQKSVLERMRRTGNNLGHYA